MRYKLTQQQFTNLTEAVNFWLKIPRNTVKSGLSAWRVSSDENCEINTTKKPTCGSPACFGGWLPYSPYFAKLNVTPYSKTEGYPVIRDKKGWVIHEAKDLAQHLFGERELFSTSFFWEVDSTFKKQLGDNFSTWGLVLMRLAYVLENAELIIDPV